MKRLLFAALLLVGGCGGGGGGGNAMPVYAVQVTPLAGAPMPPSFGYRYALQVTRDGGVLPSSEGAVALSKPSRMSLTSGDPLVLNCLDYIPWSGSLKILIGDAGSVVGEQAMTVGLGTAFNARITLSNDVGAPLVTVPVGLRFANDLTIPIGSEIATDASGRLLFPMPQSIVSFGFRVSPEYTGAVSGGTFYPKDGSSVTIPVTPAAAGSTVDIAVQLTK